MKAQLVCDALTMAIWLRRARADSIHHSDRGSQYTSKAFRRLLKDHRLQGSMTVGGIVGIMPLLRVSLGL